MNRNQDQWDIIREIWDKDFIEVDNKKMTLLDLSNIGNLEHDEMIELLNQLLDVSITSPEGIQKVNDLVQSAYWYMKDELLYTDTELKKLGNIQFQNSSDIIHFLQKTKNSHGIYKCVLWKIALCYKNSVTDSISEYREKSSNVLENKVIENLRDMSQWSSISYASFWNDIKKYKNTGKLKFQGSIYYDEWKIARKIPFHVELREKSIESSISKSIREKDYINQWNICDFLWMRILCENKNDQIIVMNFISQIAFKKWEYCIKNKWWITEKMFEDILVEWKFERNVSNKWFIELLNKSFENTERRISTAVNYKDVKIIPEDTENNKLRAEIMFLTHHEYKKSNEWLSHHACYRYKRKITERIRLDNNHIAEKTIKLISNALLDELKGWIDKETGEVFYPEILQDIFIDIILSDQNILPASTGKTKEKMIQSILKEDLSVDRKKERLKELYKNASSDVILKKLRYMLPKFYISGLFPYIDRNWRIAKTNKKYTNIIWRENLGILEEYQKTSD